MIHQSILANIIEGRLKPGQKLLFQSLRDSYGTSDGPIRTALSRLAEHGFVIHEERKGFRVAPTSVKEFLEIVQTRCLLEEAAIRESIRLGDDHWVERVSSPSGRTVTSSHFSVWRPWSCSPPVMVSSDTAPSGHI